MVCRTHLLATLLATAQATAASPCHGALVATLKQPDSM